MSSRASRLARALSPAKDRLVPSNTAAVASGAAAARAWNTSGTTSAAIGAGLPAHCPRIRSRSTRSSRSIRASGRSGSVTSEVSSIRNRSTMDSTAGSSKESERYWASSRKRLPG